MNTSKLPVEKLTVQAKIGVLLGIMLVVAAANVGAVYYTMGQTDSLQNSVNVAGQQRMLSQRMARYSTQIAAGDDPEASREKLRNAVETFDSNLATLADGGTKDGVAVRAAPGAVTEDLDAERQKWNEYRPHVRTVLTADPESEEFEQSLAYVQSNSNDLMKVSDDLTSAFAQVSASRKQFMKPLLLGLFALDVVVFGVGLVASRRFFSDPIRRLSSATDALASGDFEDEALRELDYSDAASTDRERINDEIELMKRTFGEMKANLRTAFDQLQEVSEELETGQLDGDVHADLPGSYGTVMERLDEGTAQLESSFQEIEAVSDGLRTGRLDHDVDTDRPGRYGVVLGSLATGTDELSDSFAQISSVSEGLKEGRLDQQFDTDYPGEYGNVIEYLEESVGQLSASVRTVQEVADEVAASSEEVASNSAEIEQASEQIATSVEEISHGSDTQSQNLDDVFDEMNDLSATIEEIASSAEEVAATTSTAVQRGETGREYAAEATDEIRSIESQAERATSQVQTLDDEMDEISEVVEMITGIAEQTNMLALNASIEAARAGEAGEGFAVVADEIKSLAEDVARATTDIEERIEGVQSMTNETVGGIREMSERVTRGSETIEDAIEMFDEIADAVEEVEAGIQEISEATDEQAVSTEEIVTMVDELSIVSDQTATEASNAAQATEDQASSLSKVSESIQHLSRLAESLHDQTSEFEVREADSRRAPPSEDASRVESEPVDGDD